MELYGILAHPVAHSLSPTIHNAGFKALKINAKYTKFDIAPAELGNFITRVREEKIAGLSVSMPHKIAIRQYLDYLTPEAETIGAVNGVFWQNEKLCGDNTDISGAMRALEEKTDLKNKKVVIFGAGGAAHAIVYGLKQKGAKITILDCDGKSARILAKKYGANFALAANYPVKNFDIVINATPVGMYPHIEASILQTKDLRKGQLIFDIVYNPLETKLIRNAQKAGCAVITGDRMFLYQGIRQFEIWTGQKAPLSIMEKALLKKLRQS